MAKIGWNFVTADSLKQFLLKLSSELNFAIYQTVTKSFFETFKQNEQDILSVPMEDIEKARIFGKECEIRWVREDNDFHVIIICENDDLFNLVKTTMQNNEGDILELVNENETEVILWGERDSTASDDDKFWYEGRIPQKINYPIANKGQRVKLTCLMYSEKENRKSKFYRFKEVNYA